MFKVLNPYYLFLLALPVLMALLYLRHRTTGARRLGEIVDPGLVPVIAPDHRPRRAHIAAALTVCAAVLMIGAAAWPMIGTGTKLARASGVDVVVAVDVSKSMSSRDVTPSRLERAKIELGEFIKRLHGDRVGVVVFAGEAFTQCPLTTDYEAAMLFIRSIDRNSVPQPGTSLKKAIATAREMLRHVPEGAKSKVLVLMSDGEDHEGEAVEEAKAAAEEGVVIDTIGIGSTAGEPVPDFDASGVMTGYKKDKAGQTVMSRLNEATLKQIAQAAGGVYVHATDNDLGMETVLAEIKKMAKSEMQSRLTVEYEQRYRWLLLPALAMLILVTILPLSAAIRRTKDQGVKNA